MSLDAGVEKVLEALARLQCDEPISEVIAVCGPEAALIAASVQRARDADALCPDISEIEIVTALMSLSGPMTRRRVLSHLRKSGVIQPDTPLIKVMTPGSVPTMRAILRHAAARNGRTLEDIQGDSRRSESVLARFEAGWVSVRLFGFPVTAMAEAMGKNHTTLLSGINKVDIMIQRSPLRLDGLVELAEAVEREAIERYVAQFQKRLPVDE